ncbi:MAG: tetratricopeptide repeat protein [Firmicutes bacterium]|nr:tetratricopeptide repeat protein [Bacillota bacterium]
MNFFTAILLIVIIALAFRKSIVWGVLALVLACAYAVYLMLPRLYAMQLQKAFRDGDYEKTKAIYEKHSKRLNFQQKASYAYMLIQMGEPAEAAELMSFFIRMQGLDAKNRAIAKRQRCLAYYRLARYEEALKDARDVYEDGYMTKNMYGLMGMIMLVLDNDLAETTKFCEEAYEYDEDDRDIQDNMSICYYLQGDLDMAAEINSYVREENPEFVEGYYHGAQIFIKQKKYKEAKELLEKIPSCNRTPNTTVSEEAVMILEDEVKNLISGKVSVPAETPVFTVPEPVAPAADFYDEDDEEGSIYDEYNAAENGEKSESIYDEYNALEDDEKPESIYDEYNALKRQGKIKDED